ncbi:secoisolariciresinol dehydrogenase-like [Cucurbita pepo subsp. pepo]|uniref:secoisolariciresinol dehydrogenase-like n=1 Tax=Cucurbita pepo subsp. pepo TaxID=3664 RepID=UPI000C9D3C90|nr:secoisolariciresinol dehydrogenase-like [Cucurbita pepo subsp. pepo]
MGISLLPAAARRLEGKVAVITGAPSGIGESTAKLFFKHGAKVMLADILDYVGHSLSRHLCSSSSSFIHCDVTKENIIENTVTTAISKYGKLDIMLNNAGISGTSNSTFSKRIIDFQKVPSMQQGQ